MTYDLSCSMNQGGVRRRLGRLRDALRYTQVYCARLAGLFAIGEPRIQWFLRLFPAAIHPQMAIVSLAGEEK
ncbi:Bgt-20611 [Blumeria graminis f. sp. tritici]|uniref:Bgt-20611 n=1 Tax=Blumeria graminis f. sp. tritici TaxID=62690 RepID=A0A9X9L921_BLUGR|nr:Bgt-20611 [Blumeria graminis f. sp. tritici]